MLQVEKSGFITGGEERIQLYGTENICYTCGNDVCAYESKKACYAEKICRARVARLSSSSIHEEEHAVMRLNAPKKFTFWSSLVIFVLGMIVAFHLVPFIPANYGVIAVFVGYGLLFAGNLLKGF